MDTLEEYKNWLEEKGYRRNINENFGKVEVYSAISNYEIQDEVRSVVDRLKCSNVNLVEVIEWEKSQPSNSWYKFLLANSSGEILNNLDQILEYVGFGFAPPVWEPNPEYRNTYQKVEFRRSKTLEFILSEFKPTWNFRFVDISDHTMQIKLDKIIDCDLASKVWDLNKVLYAPDYDEIYTDTEFANKKQFLKIYLKKHRLFFGSVPDPSYLW